jgi:hypothetical protein
MDIDIDIDLIGRIIQPTEKMIRYFQIMDNLPSGLDQHVSVG